MPDFLIKLLNGSAVLLRLVAYALLYLAHVIFYYARALVQFLLRFFARYSKGKQAVHPGEMQYNSSHSVLDSAIHSFDRTRYTAHDTPRGMQKQRKRLLLIAVCGAALLCVVVLLARCSHTPNTTHEDSVQQGAYTAQHSADAVYGSLPAASAPSVMYRANDPLHTLLHTRNNHTRADIYTDLALLRYMTVVQPLAASLSYGANVSSFVEPLNSASLLPQYFSSLLFPAYPPAHASRFFDAPFWYLPTGGAYPVLQKNARVKVLVNLSQQRAVIYQNNVAIYTMVISSGMDNTTPRGDFRIGERDLHFYNPRERMGANYWVAFKGTTYLFHSVPTTSREGSYIAHEAEKLGVPASHGCIRLSVADAQWFYRNIPRNTAVHIS